MQTQRDGAGRRVLVVDDDPSMCDVLSNGLGSRGFETVCRLSADHALEEVTHRDYDVVLTDLDLGRTSGFEVCERVHSQRSDICIVVMTAFGTLDNVVRAIRVGAYD